MKKFTFILISMFLVGGLFAQQLHVPSFSFAKKAIRSNVSQTRAAGENNDFETWHSDYAAYGLGEMPTGFDMITGNPTGQKSTDANSGTYAMRVESNVTTNVALGFTDTLVGGYAFSSQGMLFGADMFQPYTLRPTTMTFWAKGEMMGVNDSALVIFQMTKNGELVGAAVGQFGASQLTTTYQQFTLTFNYALTDVPDSAALIISSTGVGLFTDGDIGTLTAGSYMIIDNISYEYEVLTDPSASCSPLAWDAGSIDQGTSATSETFTLTNVGGGTLIATGATALSAPWSTTFVAGDVSLDAAATYDFTFDFAPVAAGSFDQTFVINTNGGDITISLTGSGNIIITGEMDGGFENNVNDFDLTFEGWVQHDVDLLPTYGFTTTDFTNSGYTGSFIAFNPASTTPAMTDAAILPHSGARFGACFAGVPAAPVVNNNDWLITPQSDVLNSGAKVQMYVKSFTADYGLERYTINVSTTGTDVANFTKISAGSYLEAPETEWTLVEYDLSSYAGQQIYVGIQCLSADMFIFMVDDIVIDNPTSVNTDVKAAVSVFPNPASSVVTVANAENANIVILNMVGEVVANVENASANQTIDMSNFADGTYFVRVNAEVFKINLVK